ncbi:unnamed protein product [Ophioblennius macclurei]
MATVPPGPSALPASPAESPPFPATGIADPAAAEEREPGCHGDHRVPAATAGTNPQPVIHDQQRSVAVKKQQQQQQEKSMLARASPAALHLKMQAREQQQLNGLAEADSRQHAGNRPDNPTSPVDNCDSGGGGGYDGAPAARNNSEDCQHEGHSPCSKNGSHSPLVNNSMNGMPGFTRTEAAQEYDRTQPPQPPPPRPPCDQLPADGAGAGPGGEPPPPPPVAELARLDLSASPGRADEADGHGIRYVRYESELQMPWIMRLITKDLSEPYSIYTYRYFIHNWPQLCFLAMVEQECVGAIVCKLDMHKKMFRRGYIAMLAVDSKHRRKSIGTNLVKKAIYAMVEGDCDEVVLETEITNKSALKLYENLGFVRDKRLFRYYLNGVDALRLKLWLR